MLDLRQSVDSLRWCLDQVADTLQGYGCEHGDHTRRATPPMMYPEWIRCVVAKREQEIDDLRAYTARLEAAATIFAFDPIILGSRIPDEEEFRFVVRARYCRELAAVLAESLLKKS